jgi:cell division septum initiation protein DivIVA
VQIDWLDGLESRVHDAVEHLGELRQENRKLRDTVKDLETRLAGATAAPVAAPAPWEAEREEVRRRVEALTARLEGLAAR